MDAGDHMANRRAVKQSNGMPQYGGRSGYHAGAILILLGILTLILGGNIIALIIIFAGIIIMLDYFLIKVFIKQSTHKKVRKR
jgi:hypothetical protein